MPNTRLLIILMCACIMLTAATPEPASTQESYPHFTLSIEQDGKQIPITHNTVTLNKSAFDIVLTLSDTMGVLVNASFNKKTFKRAADNQPQNKLPGFNETGLADGLQNPDNIVYVAIEAPNYWFYENDSIHRFNSVEWKNNLLICKRTIAHIHDVNTQSDMNITDVKQPLYLVFMHLNYDGGFSNPVEVQRAYVKINWRK